MKFKKVLLPFAAGALALSLAACSEEDAAKKVESPQGETTQADTKTPNEKEAAAAEKMQAKLVEQQVDENEIVAVVNDEELKGLEYNSVLMSIQSQMQQTGQDPTSKEAVEQVKTQTLDTLVNQTLILQKAKEAKLTASKEEIDKEYATIEEQSGGEKAMNKLLKAQSMDAKTLKEKITESIQFEKYQDKVAPVKEVTDKEIQEYYDQAAAQSKESGQKLPPLEEASKQIKEMLEQQQQQELLTAHVKELKVDAKIELKI